MNRRIILNDKEAIYLTTLVATGNPDKALACSGLSQYQMAMLTAKIKRLEYFERTPDPREKEMAENLKKPA